MKSLAVKSHYVVIHRVDRSGDYTVIRKYRRPISSSIYSPLDAFSQALGVLSEYAEKYPHDLVYIDRVCCK